MKDIDDPIKKAMQDGQFDDLPGKGKPLNLDANPFADPAWELAHHVLKSSGYTLPWIETRQQIEKELEEARSDLKRTWEWKQSEAAQKISPAQVELQWQQRLRAFREKVISLNQRIRDYNLEAPSDRFHLLVLNADKEIAALVST
jgi:DnaJ homolog subfamily C member 28